MGRLDGKVAFITGAARGQGRSHAIRLAQEGADVVAVDLCGQIDSVPYQMSSHADMDVTVGEVQALGRRIVAEVADVRDVEALQKALDTGLAELGGVDIVVANAGIAPLSVDEKPWTWKDVIDVNLTGVFNTVEVAIPSMIDRGTGGAIVLISSTAGLNGIGGGSHGALSYVASKHGVVGLMRSYANNLGQHLIRVNSIHPSAVNTPMIMNDAMETYLSQVAISTFSNADARALPVERLESADISNALLYLVTDEGRHVTGVALSVDAGFANKK